MRDSYNKSPISNYDINQNNDNKFNDTLTNYEVFNNEDREWDEESKNYLLKIKSKCEKLSIYHKKNSLKNKKLHLRWSFLNLLIPLLMAPVTALTSTSNFKNYLKFLEVTIFIVLSIINTILIKFKFHKKQQKHMISYLKYIEIVNEIEYQLLKPKKYRENVNMFCSKIKTKFVYLNRSTFIF